MITRIPLLLAIAASIGFSQGHIPPTGDAFEPENQMGVCVTGNFSESGGYGTTNARNTFAEIASLGANYVTLIPVGWSFNSHSTEIFGYQGEIQTLTPEGVRQAIRDAHAEGLKVLLSPHLWVGLQGTPHFWRGNIKMKSNEDWEKWFKSYRQFISFWARIAEEEKVALFSVGSELVETTRAQPETWREIIRGVRGIYSGPCIYSANWHDEYDRIPFWDELEYAAISAYFPIGDGSKADRMQAADQIRDRVRDFSERIGKPILFAESGFRSVRGAGSNPSGWGESGIPAPAPWEQALCYEVWIETFADASWLSGIHWWAVHSDPGYIPFVLNGFDFRGKPAEDILRQYFEEQSSVSR